MPIGGALKLKGGERVTKDGVVKKKKKQAVKVVQEGQEGNDVAGQADKSLNPAMVDVQTGKTYEEAFGFEAQRIKETKARSTPWGSSYRPAPEILHGYDKKVTGKTASERLDMRSAVKHDKYCK